MDLKTLSSQVDISKNYLKTKIDCLEDVREAYFLKTEISQKEWDGIHYPNFFPKEPRNRWEKDKAEERMREEYNLFHRTLTLAQDHYYKLAMGSNISEDDPRTNVDIKKLRKTEKKQTQLRKTKKKPRKLRKTKRNYYFLLLLFISYSPFFLGVL